MEVGGEGFTRLMGSGRGTRVGIWAWMTGLSLMKWAAYTGLAAAAGAIVLVALLVVPRWRAGAWSPILALGLALGAALPPILLLEQAKSVPAIHDITTDPFHPPVSVALMHVRTKP